MNTETVKLGTLEARVQKKMAEFLELPAVKDGLAYVQRGLEGRYPQLAQQSKLVLPYHNVEHAKDVLHEALLFALYDGNVSNKEMELLALAAVYHDAGFTNGEPAGHEERSAGLVAQQLPQYGYGAEEVRRIQTAILAGPNKELRDKEILSAYLIDADTSNFGREDFFEKMHAVFKENMLLGLIPEDTPETRKEAYLKLFAWMPHSEWKTGAAWELRSEKHKENIQKLKQMIEEL